MSSFTIGLSGLSVNQTLMDLTGQNVANASDPTYHAQDAILAPVTDGTPVGAGVSIEQVRRLISSALEAALNNNASAQSDTTAQLRTLQQVQSYLASSGTTGTLQSQLETFFNDAQHLSLTPDDLTQRTVVLNDAQTLATQINGTSSAFDQVNADLVQQGGQFVDQVNQLTAQIATLNGRISISPANLGSNNALLDQRDGAIGQLAQLVNVRTLDQGNGQTSVYVGGQPLVIGNQSIAVSSSVNSSNQLVVGSNVSSGPLTNLGGSLGAVLTLRNQLVPDYQNQLNTFTNTLVHALDTIQATGLGLSGPMTTLSSGRAVSSTTVALSQAGLAYPPPAGSLFISVTNLASGQRSTQKINIDPSTNSLQDVAAAIGGIPNLQAVVNNQTGTMTILAAPGFAFDFAGRLSTSPDTQTITGSAIPQISGQYTGTANDTFTYTVVGSGAVGSATNLTLNVSNSAGVLLGSANIGQGYSPGSPLPPVEGVGIALSAGTVNAGDSFSVQTVARPDSAGISAALGLNTFFLGDASSGLQVNPDLLNAPGQFALSGSGAVGDDTNLQRIIALSDQPVLAGNTQTMSQYLIGFLGTVADNISNLNQQNTAQQSVGQTLRSQQQTVSGVDPNEQLVKLLQYQQGYQMASKFISVVNQSLADLFNVVT
jgi:flagellar hook-associated protein 1